MSSFVADVIGIDYLCPVNDVNVVYLVYEGVRGVGCGRLFYAEVLHMFYSRLVLKVDNLRKSVLYSDIRQKCRILISEMLQEKAGTPFCVCA